ncbi:MAG: hypothetical protein NTX42_01955 [Methanothrix sp.]|nr:hypothetical protein [Methanothrix sp.]
MPPLPKSNARKTVYPGPALPGSQARPASRAPERLPGSRTCLADDGCRPGWPLPASGPTGTARGPWRKIVLLSSQLRATSAFV